MLPLSVSVLELVRAAVYLICQRVEQSGACLARPYMVNYLLAERHLHVVIARQLFVLHRAPPQLLDGELFTAGFRILSA
jgi:hypothetical protein